MMLLTSIYQQADCKSSSCDFTKHSHQLCLGVRFLLFFLHRSSLHAFKYRFNCYFSRYSIFVLLVSRSHRACDRRVRRKEKLAVWRLLMNIEIWQAANQRWEPASETRPRHLNLQVVYSPALAAGGSSWALLTQWKWAAVFVRTSGSRVWRCDLICLNAFNTPGRTWLCHHAAFCVALRACSRAFPLPPLVSSHTRSSARSGAHPRT